MGPRCSASRASGAPRSAPLPQPSRASTLEQRALPCSLESLGLRSRQPATHAKPTSTMPWRRCARRLQHCPLHRFGGAQGHGSASVFLDSIHPRVYRPFWSFVERRAVWRACPACPPSHLSHICCTLQQINKSPHSPLPTLSVGGPIDLGSWALYPDRGALPLPLPVSVAGAGSHRAIRRALLSRP